MCKNKYSNRWWLVRDTLMVAFDPNILGGGGEFQIIFLLKNESSLSGVDNHRLWGHSNPTGWYKIELYAISRQ